MSRFDDFLPDFEDEFEFRNNILTLPLADVLRWEVIPNDGTAPYEFDLSEFQVGDPERGIVPRANLIRQLAPAIRVKSHGRGVYYKYGTRDCLVKLWRFLDSLVSATGREISDLAHITSSHGALFKNWLLRSTDLKLEVAARNFIAVNALIRVARKINGFTTPDLLWPTIMLPRRTIHGDVDPRVLAHLYRHVKELHRGFRAAEGEGRSLLDGATQTGEGNLSRPRQANSKEEIARLAYDFVRESLVEPEIRLTHFAAKSFFNQRKIAAPSFIPQSDRRPFDAIRWFAPTSEDAVAAFIMVLLHTGWNPETVFGIDVSDGATWYDDRLEGMSAEDKTATVAIYGLKGKTGSEQVAFCLKQPWSHPYQVIKYMVGRTAELRKSLRFTLEKLATISHPTLSERRKIANLQRMIKSPWLYITCAGNVRGKPGGRVSHISVQRCHRIFKSLRKSAATNIPVGKSEEDRNRIIQGLDKLKLSDARDGFAAFIYDNSLYNILLLKHALGHGSISATKHYIRQRNQIIKRFEHFTRFQEIVFDEVRNHRRIDPTILFIRSSVGEVSAEQRERLADYRMRTRMNMGCLSPLDPPSEFSKANSGSMCRVHRCTLCRHGVVFEDSFPAIAVRQAELSFIRSRSSSDSFERSSFSAEWAAIRVLIDHVFPNKSDEIEKQTAIHLKKLNRGIAYLFNQMPIDLP